MKHATCWILPFQRSPRRNFLEKSVKGKATLRIGDVSLLPEIEGGSVRQILCYEVVFKELIIIVTQKPLDCHKCCYVTKKIYIHALCQ